ncbi:hypothetical protein L9F63_016845, partial [Diploptera punctata]
MFTFQSNNQVLFHLTQLTSAAFNPRRPCSPRATGTALSRSQQSTSSQNDADIEIICSDSLNTAVNNCTEFTLEYLPKVKIGSFEKLASRLFWNQQAFRPFSKTKLTLPWQVAYSSSETFFENKYGFPEQQLSSLPTTSIRVPERVARKLLFNMVVGRPFTFDVQVRGFKTERSMKAERLRNPTLGNRLSEALGLSETDVASASLRSTTAEKLGSIHQTGVDAEKIKAMIADESLTTEEQQRMKVAFAEGYLAGTGQRPTGWTRKCLNIIQQMLTIVVLFVIFVSFMASASGSMFRIQLGSQVEVDPEEIHVTFEDVKGADEAKQELKDVVEFLKNPSKFSAVGAKLPKGVLLVGPPGTGKTLLARAVAGEAGVPFFHAAGPEFDEILVGQGARRVRDLFKAAKDRAPCVIFIDEIDSVGSKRTNSTLHPYANQTINQLLSEMDGFHQNQGVMVLGATNRRDDLDKALLRPGRFDVEVNVPTPDYTGRKEILSMYLGKVLSKDVDVEMLARGTTGFTGADLENMVNQAALRAAIDGADSVTMKHLENARDKLIIRPERKSRIPDEEANIITAYHEGGHAIVAYFTKDSHPLHKVTIIPRGPSLGHTAYIPEKERYHVTKSQLLAMMDTMMGGRAAEELIFGPDKITSGASSDLQKATAIATHMVKEWGMSEKVGLRTLDGNNSTYVVVNEVSPSTSDQIDSEIKRILSESYERAKNILKSHQKEHKMLAEALLKYETLDAEDIKTIMSGETPEKTQPPSNENSQQ